MISNVIIYEIILFLLTIFILYHYINDDFDDRTTFIYLIILFVLMVVFYNNYLIQENFTYTKDNDSPYKTNKQKRIDLMNSNRNTAGRFYVDCHACGRDRIL